MASMDELNYEVYEIKDDFGWCIFCGEKTHLLAGPAHSPCNAEANWVCEAHVDSNHTIVRDES